MDNTWRDSFVVKPSKVRFERENHTEYTEDVHQDNSSLLELEKKANLVKPSGGDGLFAGTYFEPAVVNGQGGLISKGLSISATPQSTDPVYDEPDIYDSHSPNKERRGKSVFGRATQVLENLAERISSGGDGVRRRSREDEESSLERDREKSTDGDRRKSTAPQRVKSVYAKLQRATSRRKGKNENMDSADAEPEAVEPESIYSSANPKFAYSDTSNRNLHQLHE